MNKTNDQIILDRIIKAQFAESGDEFTLPEYFEIFTASQILKDFELSYDDIKFGIVGKGGDGGIDSIYTFINGELLNEDSSINQNQKKADIQLIVIQSKTSSGFSEDAITKFRESAEDLFNLDNNPDNFSARYNSELIDKSKLFRNAITALAITFPKIEICYFYASQGDEIHENVSNKVPKLEGSILSMFSGATFSFEFITASKLLGLIRKIPSNFRILEVSESPISTADGSYICLVNLIKYFEFISDSGSLVRSIFESNVRDYQGSVVVNTSIRKTLENKHSENFWFLNNGVTIITPKSALTGKRLTIEDPQIVNGLQTSHEIYAHFSKLESLLDENRSILVRIICEENEEARDRIIRATNNQTSIPPASLRSSDEIHRNIEDFLKSNGYYYDRKKNYYKNQGMPITRIISIPYLAQSMMAITLLKPDSARARPSTLLNSDTEYKKIFSLDMPIDVYLKVIQIMKAVENFLKPDKCGYQLERKEITNIKYYIAMVVGIRLTQGKTNIAENLSLIPNVQISNEQLEIALQSVINQYYALGASDQIAKGSNLLSQLLSQDLVSLKITDFV